MSTQVDVGAVEQPAKATTGAKARLRPARGPRSETATGIRGGDSVADENQRVLTMTGGALVVVCFLLYSLTYDPDTAVSARLRDGELRCRTTRAYESPGILVTWCPEGMQRASPGPTGGVDVKNARNAPTSSAEAPWDVRIFTSGPPAFEAPTEGRAAHFFRPQVDVPIRARSVPAYYATNPLLRSLRHNFSVMSLAEFASNETHRPDDYGAYCELAIATSPVCRVLPDESLPVTAAAATIANVTAGNASTQDGGSDVPATETVWACIQRHRGDVDVIARAIPFKCARSPWFAVLRRLLATAGAAASGARSPPGNDDPSTPNATRSPDAATVGPIGGLFQERTRPMKPVPTFRPYLDPAKRPKYKFGPPVQCVDPAEPEGSSANLTVFPISYAIPAENFVKARRTLRAKLWDFAPLIPVKWPGVPGQRYPILENDEWLGKVLHERSFYAWTHKRGGWDCLRHYEILASGAIPYFIDLPQAPADCVTNLPKTLLIDAMRLTGLPIQWTPRVDLTNPWVVYKHKTKRSPKTRAMTFIAPAPLNHETFNFTRYFEIADEILNYSREYLTTPSLAAYMLEASKNPRPKHVLLFETSDGYDYLGAAIVHGLYSLGVPTTIAGATLDSYFAMPYDANATRRGGVGGGSNTTSDADGEEVYPTELLDRYPMKPKVGKMVWVYGLRIKDRPYQDHRFDLASTKDLGALEHLFLKGSVPPSLGLPKWRPGHPPNSWKNSGGASKASEEETQQEPTWPTAPPLPPVDLVVYVRSSSNAFDTPETWPMWGIVSQKLPKSRIIIVDAWDLRSEADANAAMVSLARNGTLFRREIHPRMCQRRT